MGLVTLVTDGLIGHVSMNGDIQQTCSFFTGFQCFDSAMGIRSTTIINLERGYDLVSELVWWVELLFCMFHL